MLHNTLYRLSRNQKRTLTILAILFLISSIVWFIFELYNVPFPMEPLVVFIGGIATLFATFWPWKATNKNKQIKDTVIFDYTTNNGLFNIGSSTYEFTLKFSKASDTCIHVYSDPQNIESIATIPNSGRICEIKDVSCLDYSNRVETVSEGQLFALKNKNDNYAIVHIKDIRDSSRSDRFDEVVFSYIINTSGGTDFS